MLTNEEEKFLKWWSENRLLQQSPLKQLSLGLPLGILIGIGILLNFMSGWYTRATMVANSQSTPMVLIIAIIIISLFCSYFYKKHQWEMNEQRYKELLYKKQKAETQQNLMQQ